MSQYIINKTFFLKKRKEKVFLVSGFVSPNLHYVCVGIDPSFTCVEAKKGLFLA